MFEIEAYIDRNGKLCIKPLTPDAEEDLKEWLEKFRRSPHEYVDVETEMPEQQYQNYKRQKQRWGYGNQGSQTGFGFQPTSYMPQPPDFTPMAHHMPWLPWLLPFILREGGVDYGGQDRGSDRGGRGGRGGEYDGTGRGTENPRDTGRGDSPRR
jgi:hypothetical protein